MSVKNLGAQSTPIPDAKGLKLRLKGIVRAIKPVPNTKILIIRVGIVILNFEM